MIISTFPLSPQRRFSTTSSSVGGGHRWAKWHCIMQWAKQTRAQGEQLEHKVCQSHKGEEEVLRNRLHPIRTWTLRPVVLFLHWGMCPQKSPTTHTLLHASSLARTRPGRLQQRNTNESLKALGFGTGGTPSKIPTLDTLILHGVLHKKLWSNGNYWLFH